MFDHPLPSTIKPLKLARQQGKLKGYLLLSELPDLAADCLENQGRVEAELRLEMQGRWPVLTGVAATVVRQVCQRCLETVDVPVQASIALGFVSTDEALDDLPDHLEPFLLQDEEIPLADLLAQELILALPIVAYHPECEEISYQAGDGGEATQEPESKPNPFRVLEQLKGTLKKPD